MPLPSEIVDFTSPPAPPGADPWVDGATPETGITLASYDDRWPGDFERIGALVRGALGWRALQVEHVGSTSVVGLPAKPIIDVDLVVADSGAEGGYVPALVAAGFVLRVREPWAWGHRMLRHEEPRCNLHVWGPAAPEPVRHRLFRDWLRGNPDDLARYRDAKVEAAEAANAAGEHTMQYNARKQAVIREIYDRAFRAAGLLDT
ncbi:GrpB family protein [Nocardioides sp. WS12]|uniref:GrpB family protein n=1 Tax=Nocardioides sp. WS12 TaxID=2486272 RepID=UPI0015FBE7D3|nr:GrpB family protein [Nocardioides sp. WS12]